MDLEGFRKMKRNILKKVDKVTRYQNHSAFIGTYVKMNSVPKGFRLKFHNNLDFDTGGILKKCSMKLMKRTVTLHYKQIKKLTKEIEMDEELLSLHFNTQYNEVMTDVTNKTKRINEQLLNRHKMKFTRDGLNVNNALEISSKMLKNNQEKWSTVNVLKSEILKDVEIPSQDPIILTDNPKFQESAFKSLCAKGPSYVPTPKTVNWSQLQLDFDKFRNTIRREIHFSKEKNVMPTANAVDAPPRCPSIWVPPKSNIPDAEMFLKCVERDIFVDTSKKKPKSNLTKEENEMLSYCMKDVLFNRDSTEVLRLQDKGNKFVVVKKETDIQKAERQIIRSSMEKVEYDPTRRMIDKVKNWCNKWKDRGHLSKEWASFIVNEDARPAKNNPLYKTHKNEIPVRLLTSGNGSATENLSLYVEKKCGPLANSLKSKIKDTGHMLEIIDELNTNGIPENVILVSLDVENMFPSIDNERGLCTLKRKLDKREVLSPPSECLLEALEIILTSNNSIFNGQHLLQTNGTATGSKNSCSYADLALEPVDEQIYQAKRTVFKELVTYFRFRDDCFLLWNGPIDLLKKFVYFVNIIDRNLKFTVEIGGKSLKFMDLLITIENGKLETTVYSKPTDGHLYLHNNSCHPKAIKEGVEKGVALRLRRICSTEEKFEKQSKNYKAFLVNRQHIPKEVVNNFEKVKTISRNEARRKKVQDNKEKKHRFFTEFNPNSPNISKIIKKHEHLLRGHEKLNKLFPLGSFQVVNRRGKNLRELILRADPYSTRPIEANCEYRKCGKCDSCKNFVVGSPNVKSFATGKHFKIRKNMNCNTPNVIYVAECKKCKEQGVGSTVNWKARLSNYKTHIKNKHITCRIVKHFTEVCPDNNDPVRHLSFNIIDMVDNTNGYSEEELDDLLLKKEKRWIRNLVTLHKGMNSTHDLNRTKRRERESLK